MKGYHLRSRSVPLTSGAPETVTPHPSAVSYHTTEGPVDESVPVGQSLV